MKEQSSILVVDDTPINLDILVSLLKKQYRLTAATNGQEAIEIALKNPPDLILLDIMMPVMDGYETIINLKEYSQTVNIPVIFLTAMTGTKDVLKGLKLGAADYVTKPFNPPELLARVNNVIEMTKRAQVMEELLQQRNQALNEIKTEFSHACKFSDLNIGVKSLALTIPSKMDSASGLIDYLGECIAPICEAHHIDITKLNLCLNEAIINAVVHGNLEVQSSLKEDSWGKFYDLIESREASPTYADRTVSVKFTQTEDQFEFEIEDEGKGFNATNLPDPDDPKSLLTSGRGILLLRSFMNQVSWNEKGNKIRLMKQF